MEVDAKILNVLFRRIPPELVYQRLQQKLQPLADVRTDRKLMLRFAATELGAYSQNEQDEIFCRVREEAAVLAHQTGYLASPEQGDALGLPALAFFSLLQFSQGLLTQQAQEPLCQIHQVGLWRNAFLALGQDLFVCAYLARQDIQRHQRRENFSWPAVIRTDCRALNRQLRQGLAENHYHFYGSTQTFPLTWCGLMSYPGEVDEGSWAQFDQFLQPSVIRGPGDSLLTSRDRVRYAAFCRSFLFRRLHREPEKNLRGTDSPQSFARSDSGCNNCPNWQERGISWAEFDAVLPELQARKDIRTLLNLYGAKIPQPGGGFDRLDYALEEHILQATPDSPYRSLAGERSFLYDCFQAFFQNRLTEEEQYIFYLYLLLKEQFRSEMIQVNQQVGFQNFFDYERRKGELLSRDSYWVEATRMGMNAPLSMGSVTSLEARITPTSTDAAYMEKICQIDKQKKFSDRSYFDKPDARSDSAESQSQQAIRQPMDPLYWKYKEEPYFYVIHFVKQQDQLEKVLPSFSTDCRHQALRRKLETEAVALARALSNSHYLCSRIRGIDACSNEIGCPPEVFAVAFRFLRNYRDSDFYRGTEITGAPVHRLSLTYHAGEDFLDLASALRSIDEAVSFLGFQRDDRIGHCLGLGVEPEAYYEGKGRHLYMKKQERLDNLVWLLFRSRELGVTMNSDLESRLRREAEILLQEIYGEAMRETARIVTLLEYYCSMQLRGDDPSLYCTGSYNEPHLLCDPYTEYKANEHDPRLNAYRKNPVLTHMYYLYHYNTQVRKNGAQTCRIEIIPDDIWLIRQTQDGLQEYLQRKGIIIECNPSSNVLIGTFGSYRRHPIFRFNNIGLQGTCASKQLQVCVNTDDLGVFDTSLEFEYALLYHALATEQKNGVRQYQDDDILHYLQNLQTMGMRAVFPGCADSDIYHT